MRYIFSILGMAILLSNMALGQTCTITSGGNWPRPCSGGTPANSSLATTIIINSGVSVNMGANTWSGTSLTVNGTLNLNNNASSVTATTISVASTGLIDMSNRSSTLSATTLNLTGDLTSSGSGATINITNLNISGGDVTVNRNISVTTFNMTAGTYTSSNDNITVSGTMTAGGTISIGSGDISANTLTVNSGGSISADNITVTNALTLSGTISNGTGDISASSMTINSTGALNTGGDMTVTGTTTVSGGLTMGGGLLTTGSLLVGSTGTLTTNAAVTINVTNTITVAGTLDMNSNSAITANLLIIEGDFTIDGGNPSIAIGGGITIQDGGVLDIDTAPDITGNITVGAGGSLIVNGNADFTGNLSLSGDSPSDPAYMLIGNNAQVVVNGNVAVGTDSTDLQDRLEIQGKIDIGTSSGCGYTLTVYGVIDAITAGNQDRVNICNTSILKGTDTGNDCNEIPTGPDDDLGPVYCLANTFTGPLVFDEDGFQPVTLVLFKVSHHGDYNLCEWQTATEFNNSHFEVQRSTDGRNFNSIGRVEGVGNTNELQSYDFVDHETRSGIAYYRLKQVDFDGTTAYSKIVSVLVNINVGKPSIFPNPIAAEQFTVAIPFGSITSVKVYSVIGQEVQSSTEMGSSESNKVVSIANQPKGKYIVEVATSTGIFRGVVVKIE